MKCFLIILQASVLALSGPAPAAAQPPPAPVRAPAPPLAGGGFGAGAASRDSALAAPVADEQARHEPAVDAVDAVDGDAGPAAEARGDGAQARRGVDYLWVPRTALLTPASIDSVVARARAMGVRGLLVQVVGRGDAYYRSAILPRAEAIPAGSAPDFDPLGEVLVRGHAAGIEVHAWMNCLLVWSAPRRPADPRHVVNAHSEWVARLKGGRSMMQLSARERRRLGIEGVFLTPAHPRVRTWLACIAREIAMNYSVDGIHLDYIRQPDVAVGYDPTTRARFALTSGVDPGRFFRLPPALRPSVDSAWAAFQREQVTAVVREVRDSLQAARPGIALSAAVVADTIRAERRNAQPWRTWVREGVLDRVFLMCYAPAVQTVMDQLLGLALELGVSDRVVPGISVFNTSPGTAALKIKGAREIGFPRIALYAYDSLFSNPGRWMALHDQLQPAGRRTP
jgi:uncharacterized lipoprotein YddW (UPF0748 family)